ncbi:MULTISPECIES: hypothetical protein [unclassified Chryseobacterium]|uniref:hypothetical protein n=1 Tax=unclassified Chryseobacterium TaxID=2593645 RepID=UPI00115AF5DF|nr:MULTISPECIES: hypothetical protein [unclassified Chryseobacterium]MBO9692508.1 hypothetical protein [Chryseobacterium sp.]GEJ45036.1 hypothetical protein CRS_16440 [Chryseobacterium sp. ON_d1]
MKEFDIEKLERKNIYTVPENLFENIQENVMNDIKTSKKAPVFKLNWMYAAAASLALIFGATYVFNSDNDSADQTLNSKTAYVANNGEPKTESELAYETLKSDLTSVENNNQTVENQKNNNIYASESVNKTEKATETPKPVKTVNKKEETRMNDYLDSFSNSEIAELASNSTQDVYLDIYN